MSNNISKSEKELLEIIKSFGVNNIIENSKTFIDGYEIDIICPDQKIALEFDGVHWHTSQFITDNRYHLNKTELCENKGYHLIHIFENEWIEKRDIVVSRLKSIFGIHNNIIYARKCTISEVSQLETKQFLNTNHIQGNVISKKNIGLYYNDELVSIMTFGSYRINLGQTKKENEYELLRFCNKLNYHIPGAASKLLKYFIKHYNPIKIISYADRRWSKGNLYEKLGFKFVHNTQPNYYYNINDHLENRFNWRKSELSNKLKIFDPNLTEKQNMENNGYYQIYDCGSKLYELIL
jgi:very-short-patch-repair endonuclease